MRQDNNWRWIFMLLLLVSILVGSLSAYILFSYRDKLASDIRESVIAEVSGIKIPEPKPGEPGYTPVKGVDYFDGRDGREGQQGPKGEKGDTGAQGPVGPKGEKGDDGYTPVKGVDYNDGVNGQDGKDGATPEFRCNESRNMWQVRYSEDDVWQQVNDENGEPAKCNPSFF